MINFGKLLHLFLMKLMSMNFPTFTVFLVESTRCKRKAKNEALKKLQHVESSPSEEDDFDDEEEDKEPLRVSFGIFTLFRSPQ